MIGVVYQKYDAKGKVTFKFFLCIDNDWHSVITTMHSYKSFFMIDESLANQYKSLIDTAQTIVVLIPAQATQDQIAVAASLYLSLLRLGKNARLVTPQPVVTKGAILGFEQAQQDLGNQNLTVSFAYTPEQVDKVSYHIAEETGRFYLTIKPKSGYEPLATESVEFSYTGASAELVILVGVSNLEQLEQLYFGYEDLFETVPMVSIHNHTTSFGTLHIDSGSASSSSEVVAQLLFSLGHPVDSDVATNLLLGIEWGTASLSSPTASAETFEVVAQLLRAGARRTFKKTSVETTVPTLLERQSVPGENESAVQVLRENNLQESENNKKNGKAKSTKNGSTKKPPAPPPEFTPVRRI